MSSNTPPLVSTDWLADHLDAPDLRILDGSWYMPATKRDPQAEFQDAHIPGALFFDLDGVSDTQSAFPHMLPPSEKFSSHMKAMGVGDGHHIIAYDGAGLFSAARLWWMFKLMGHERVSVLNGGLKKWNAEGRPVESGKPAANARHYTARVNNTILRNIADMRAIVASGREQVLDARSQGRFDGTAPEPRPGLPSGHMPGSLSLPFDQLINEDGTMKSKADLKQAFEKAGLDLARPVVTTCGSGVTAAILYLGLTLVGHKQLALYDGSWAEWAASPDCPIETA